MAENEKLIVSGSVWKHELGPSKQREGGRLSIKSWGLLAVTHRKPTKAARLFRLLIPLHQTELHGTYTKGYSCTDEPSSQSHLNS